ncbi:MAG: hypothetical protein ACJAR1_001038 [Rubritalea sp.]|jgi:hypothetical protein
MAKTTQNPLHVKTILQKKYKNIPKLVISWFDYLPDQLID